MIVAMYEQGTAGESDLIIRTSRSAATAICEKFHKAEPESQNQAETGLESPGLAIGEPPKLPSGGYLGALLSVVLGEDFLFEGAFFSGWGKPALA